MSGAISVMRETAYVSAGDEAKMERQLAAVRKYAARHMPKLEYHNFAHAQDAVKAIDRLAYFEGIGQQDLHVLRTAGYLHDIVNVMGRTDNEEKSAEIAAKLLPALGYTSEQVWFVQDVIMATKLPTKPKMELERIMCDADVENLGRDDFFRKTEHLRREMGVGDLDKWLKDTLVFMESHRYYTESARRSLDFGKAKNVEKLKAAIKHLEKTNDVEPVLWLLRAESHSAASVQA